MKYRTEFTPYIPEKPEELDYLDAVELVYNMQDELRHDYASASQCFREGLRYAVERYTPAHRKHAKSFKRAVKYGYAPLITKDTPQRIALRAYPSLLEFFSKASPTLPTSMFVEDGEGNIHAKIGEAVNTLTRLQDIGVAVLTPLLTRDGERQYALTQPFRPEMCTGCQARLPAQWAAVSVGGLKRIDGVWTPLYDGTIVWATTGGDLDRKFDACTLKESNGELCLGKAPTTHNQLPPNLLFTLLESIATYKLQLIHELYPEQVFEMTILPDMMKGDSLLSSHTIYDAFRLLGEGTPINPQGLSDGWSIICTPNT